MRRSAALWPAVILLSTAAILALFLSDFGGPVQLAAALWFLFFCPGMAWVRLLSLEHPLAEWMVAVALSIAVEGAIATALVYTQRWSPAIALDLLAVVAVAGAAMDGFQLALAACRRQQQPQCTS